MNNKTVWIIALILVLLALVACNRRQQNQNQQESSQLQQQTGQEIEQNRQEVEPVREQIPIQYGSTDDFKWRSDGSGITITGYTGSNMNVNIPPQIQGLPVIEIDGAFREGDWKGEHPNAQWVPKYQITSVTIPNTVIKIRGLAFENNQLTTITIPDSVIEIRDLAFASNQLTSVIIPDSVTSIGMEAFVANRITNLTISNNITYIAQWTFANNQLTSVTIPDSVIEIGGGAFAPGQFATNRITTITIGNNVTFEYDHLGIDNTGGFGSEFLEFYESQGSRAGTYTYSNGQWTLQ